MGSLLPATTTPNTMSHNTSPSTVIFPGPSGNQSPQPSLGMTPASRYDHNLRVMRKRDPSISSIIDQFSHVCVYHYNGQSWEKHGFEGSMFLFERNCYPPYGLYVMNRHGRNDYVQLLYPEDEVVPSQKCLIIRSYPKFVEARLKRLASLHPSKDLDKFSDVYAIPNNDEIDPKSKGLPTIRGLWTLEDNSREPLAEVMQRLHTHIAKNEAYPEEFRYGSGRPPPPNRLRALPKKTGMEITVPPTPWNSRFHSLSPPSLVVTNAHNVAGSTSDSQAQRVQSDSENERSYYSDAPYSTNRAGLSEVDKLFSKLELPTVPSSCQGGKSITQPSVPKIPSSSNPMTLTGNSLLACIFASASPSHPATTTNATKDTNRQTPTVFSPKPSVGTPGPQVLNSQALASMLTGSAPSRASSVVSQPSSREGDNEGGSRSDSPSTVLDEDSDHQHHGAIRKRPPRANADLRNGSTARLGQKVNGDVTPRLPLNGLQRTSSVTDASSIATARPTSHFTPPAPFSVRDASYIPVRRELTPFESDSDLWPSSQYSTTNTDDDGETSDIVEINFEDTCLLSDPDFTKVVKQKKSAVMLRQADTTNGAVRSLNGNGNLSVSSEKVKPKNRRRTKREKEESRDSPTVPLVATRGRDAEKILENEHPSTSRSLSSVPIHQKPVLPAGLEKTPTLSGTMVLPRNSTGSSSKSKGKIVNGHTAEALNGNGAARVVDPDAVRFSMAQVLYGQDQPIPSTTKTEFVQQVLRLLQTDESFSERLYTDYITRA